MIRRGSALPMNCSSCMIAMMGLGVPDDAGADRHAVADPTALLAVAGVVVGMLVSMALLLIGHDPLPPLSFWASIGMLSTATAVTAAVLPAWAASRRDPIKELRVP